MHGGRIDGVLRFSHSWNYEGMRNGSLMDLHVFMPGSNQKVEYKNGKKFMTTMETMSVLDGIIDSICLLVEYKMLIMLM